MNDHFMAGDQKIQIKNMMLKNNDKGDWTGI